MDLDDLVILEPVLGRLEACVDDHSRLADLPVAAGPPLGTSKRVQDVPILAPEVAQRLEALGPVVIEPLVNVEGVRAELGARGLDNDLRVIPLHHAASAD